MTCTGFTRRTLPAFDRASVQPAEPLSRIGTGEIGGKAAGLVLLQDEIVSRLDGTAFRDVVVDVPRTIVLATDVFDAFLERNDLDRDGLAELSDERIAHLFQQADLPVEVTGDLRSLSESMHAPLAVRSSGLLEDAMFRPFAGVYGTKMTPNNQPDASERFTRLAQAIKFVLASTFFASARSYVRAAGRAADEEKMAVVIQEVMGRRRNGRFYPELSGVARSYSFYPVAPARPEHGVVNLALGLGKTIVDGGLSWAYSPAWPRRPPPVHSVRATLKTTQTTFWAVNMGRPPAYDPVSETEYLVRGDLADAELDGALDLVASTYDAAADRLDPGIGGTGPRVVTFAPLLDLEEAHLNAAIRGILPACEAALGASVELEFAATFPPGEPARLALLQVRPMVVSDDGVELDEREFDAPDLLVASHCAIGNGVQEGIHDVVYVRPEAFDRLQTARMAADVAAMNERLVADGRRYVLIGFGRWGTAIPTLGVPVEWSQICGASVIVEAMLPDMIVEPSQGSHFFQNLSSFGVGYLTVRRHDRPGIDWAWLDGEPAVAETTFVRHVRTRRPLLVKVDGRTGRAGVWHGGEP
ncbi:MAG: PEP/pyruvate-binding domain-containing protein [Planctomycetota bacterium]|jgi:hypothetical protein